MGGINIHFREWSAILGMAFALGFVVITSSSESDAEDPGRTMTTTLVPAIIAFGDSAMDVGNNNHRNTFYKANFSPYGRDFIKHQPTGRFCNGKLVIDITADTLGFTKYPPAYLSPQASEESLLYGANFASAASGYDDKTALLNHAIPLSQQYKFFQEYISKLSSVVGRKNASFILGDALYLVGTGTADFLQNYYLNPDIGKVYSTPDQYSSHLAGLFVKFIKNLYGSGGRRIGVTSLPPLGCFPAARTLFGSRSRHDGCVSHINANAQEFNRKINAAAVQLQKDLPGLKMVVFDIYKALYDIIKFPSNYGFKEAGRGCCRTGTMKPTVFLCNPRSPGTCSNATSYVFWDGVHPSQAANQVLADALLIQGISIIG